MAPLNQDRHLRDEDVCIHSRGQFILAGKKRNLKRFWFSEAFLGPEKAISKTVWKIFPPIEQWTWGTFSFYSGENKGVKTEAEIETI